MVCPDHKSRRTKCSVKLALVVRRHLNQVGTENLTILQAGASLSLSLVLDMHRILFLLFIL